MCHRCSEHGWQKTIKLWLILKRNGMAINSLPLIDNSCHIVLKAHAKVHHRLGRNVSQTAIPLRNQQENHFESRLYCEIRSFPHHVRTRGFLLKSYLRSKLIVSMFHKCYPMSLNSILDCARAAVFEAGVLPLCPAQYPTEPILAASIT